MRAPDHFPRSTALSLAAWCGVGVLCCFTPATSRAEHLAPLRLQATSHWAASNRATLTLGQAPNSKKKATGTAIKVDPNAGIPAELRRDLEALPPGYLSPPLPLDQVQLVKELPIPDFPRAQFNAYQQILVRGSFREDKDRALVRTGIQWRLAKMTQKTAWAPTDEQKKEANEKNRKLETVVTFRLDIESDLRKTINSLNQFQARDEFITILCEEAPKLFDNNYYARLQLAFCLSGLESREADNVKKTPAVPALQTLPVLLKLIEDPAQHFTVKLPALAALARICRHPSCPPNQRFVIIDALLSELAASKKISHWWYGMRVVESLGELGSPDDRNRKPVVVDALLATLGDKEFHVRVRAHAATSLGKVPLETFKRIDLIGIEMVKFGEYLTEALGKEPTNMDVRSSILKVYFAFNGQKLRDGEVIPGLLTQASSKAALAGGRKTVEEAYEALKPLYPAFQANGSTLVPIAELQRSLKSWIAQRQAPGEKPPATNAAVSNN